MEKFNASVEVSGLSKAIKLLTLIVGLGISGNSMAQEKMSLEQLVKDAKQYELAISQKVVEKGQLSLLNNHPSASISGDSRISKVIYRDDKRTEMSGILAGKGNVYFFDNNADGEVDLAYIDKNTNPVDLEKGVMKTLLASAGISQTELDLSDSELMDKFVCFNLNKNEVYDTSDQSISNIPVEDQEKVKTSLQEKFNSLLKSNLEQIK